MSTDRKPTRNVTAADLKLHDLVWIHSAIDEVAVRLCEAMTQRDALLETCKRLAELARREGWYDYVVEAEQAIASAEGKQ